MAILKNVVMRGASQRLGGIVLYTRSGETIARELAPAVSNPRTRVQMQQRVKLANVVSMYKANKFWMAGAFEDKAEKETDYNAFVRFNLTDSKVALTKDAAAAGAGVVAPYRISSGSLPEIELYGSQIGVETNLYLGSMVITNATTVGQISAALITNNNGIVRGMQLSLIVNLQRSNETTNRPYIVTRAYEMIIDETSLDLLTKYFPDGILKAKETEGSPLYYDGSNIGDGAAAFILSQTISGKTKVSSQQMRMYGNQSIYSIYTSAIAVESAIRSYGSNETRFLDSSEASEFNPVVLENYIQALVYSSRVYTPGQEIPFNLNPTQGFVLLFAQAVPEDATVSVIVGADPVEKQVVTPTWDERRNSVWAKMPEGVQVSENTDVTIIVDDGENQMTFDFIAAPV